MKTNRKTRPQPSLAPLTTDEYHQLADMVCTRTYEDVRQQVNQPRSEGGFDLNISIKPLQVLHARVQCLNKINAQLASGKKLTLTAYDEIHAGEIRAPIGQSGSDIHDAIMSATYRVVTEQDNTPHQLLALQRLADFPARSALREQSAALRARSAEDLSRFRAQSAQDLSRLRHQTLAHRTQRMQITRAKEQRAITQEQRAITHEARSKEMHTHKIQLDLRKQTHKENTTAFSQHLALSKHRLNPNHFSSPDEDTFVEHHNNGGTSRARSASLSPVLESESPTSISRHTLNNHHATPAAPNTNQLNTAPSLAPNRGEGQGEGFLSRHTLDNHHATPAAPNTDQLNTDQLNTNPTPSALNLSSPLPPAVLANNRLYQQKIDSGEIRLIFAEGKHYEIEYCNPADKPALESPHNSAPTRFFHDQNRTQYLPPLRIFGPSSDSPTPDSPAQENEPRSTAAEPDTPAASDAPG